MSLRARVILLIILVIVGIMFITPSLQWYFGVPDVTKNIALGSLPQIKSYSQSAALREWEKLNVFVEQYDPAVNPQAPRLAAAYVGFLKKVFQPESGAAADPYTFKAAVEGYFRDDILNIKNLKDMTLQLGLDLQGGLYVSLSADFDSLRKQMKEQAEKAGRPVPELNRDAILQELMDQLLSRLDQFGTVEPIIRRQLGSDNIIVELPGAADPERIKKVILGKGRLNFHLVDEEGWNSFNAFYAQHPNYIPEIDPDGAVKVPEGVQIGGNSEILGVYEKDKYGMDSLKNYLVVDKTPDLSGEAITGAQSRPNPQTRLAEVLFSLGDFMDKDGVMKSGADIFADITDKNSGKWLAVVLDNKVMSFAKINEKIPNGQVVVHGQFTDKDAQDLAKILRSGSLPVTVEIQNTAEVGASLGEDTIAKGLQGLIIGALLVLAFMFIYYKGAGLFANLALIFNMFFLIAILSMTKFTLSLTSLAGIVLTIGMSVDANVLIYERMKEEFRLGKTAKAAVKAGFERAFWTILDSNVTTFLAGIILALFTKGSIQGFAFTLCAGIITSFFSAIFVSRILFDFSTDVLKLQKLSISWRRLQ
jgi:preprotein translocase subunit SecD